MRMSAVAADHTVARMRTPFGLLELASDGRALTRVAYLPVDTLTGTASDTITAQAMREVERYLDDPGYRFTVPLAPQGTDFQQRVWKALQAIPAGQPQTYGELARTLASAPRAVGQACGSNPVALFIPCHRVVGAGGSLGGFMHTTDADPLAIKRWLLAHEGSRFGLT